MTRPADVGLPLIWLEIFLGAIPLAWGIWELLSLRRELRRDAQHRGAKKGSPATSAAPDAAAHKPPAGR